MKEGLATVALPSAALSTVAHGDRSADLRPQPLTCLPFVTGDNFPVNALCLGNGHRRLPFGARGLLALGGACLCQLDSALFGGPERPRTSSSAARSVLACA